MTNETIISRRDLLATGAAGAAMLALPSIGLRPVVGSKRIAGLVLSSHLAAQVYLGFGAVLSRSPFAMLPSHFQSHTVAS